jgi:cytochrome P450
MAVDVSGALVDEMLALFAGERLADPYAVWNRVRAESPVLRAGPQVVVTPYWEVREVISNRERYASRLHHIGTRAEAMISRLDPDSKLLWDELVAYERLMMTRADDVDHDRIRRIAHRYFIPRTISRLELVVEQVVDEMLRDAGEQAVYDQRLLGQRYAARIIAEVFGAPNLDIDQLIYWTVEIHKYLGAGNSETVRGAHAARFTFRDYIDNEVLGPHRGKPGSNPLITAMMEAEGEENLTADEMNAMCALLLPAGVETTSTTITNAVIELTRHPEQWALLCEDPAKHAGNAAEELIRYLTPPQWVPRTALEPVEILGVEIEPGETVIGATAAANRDPDVYPDPNTLDFTREIDPPSIAFGYGQRFCLGVSLARMEVRLFLEKLATHYPDVRLAIAHEDIPWRGNPLFRGVPTLPVRLGRRRN